MANALFKISFLIIFLQTPILHEPFPEKLPAQKQKIKNGKIVSSEIDAKNNDLMQSLEEANFTIKKIFKKSVNSEDNQKHSISNSMTLDNKTDKWDPPLNRIKSTFTPSIFPMERIWVHNKVIIDSHNQLISSSTRDSFKSFPFSTPKISNNKFFWGNFTVKQKKGYFIMPSISPDMKIIELKNKNRIKFSFFKDANGVFYIGPLKNRFKVLDIKVLFSVPALWFSSPDYSISSYPPRSEFPGSYKLIRLTEKLMGKFSKSGNLLKNLVKYFRSFKVKPLKKYNQSAPIYEVIMKQKRGVCRHRALLFFAITKAYGFNTRLVFNKIHAFCEILLPGQKTWVRIDLGGATLPPDMVVENGDKKPIYKPNVKNQPKYKYLISGPSIPNNNNKISILIDHKNILPPFLWLKLIDIKGRSLFKKPLFPKSLNLMQKVDIKIPKVPPGKYKFIVVSPDKL